MKALLLLCTIIIILVFACAATGWFVDDFYDGNTDFMAVKFQTYDLILLIIVIPVAITLLFRVRSGRIRPQLMLPGVLIYLAFSYGLNVFNSFQNQLFLIYVAIFSLSVVGSLLALTDPNILAQRQISPKLMKTTAAVLLLIAASGYRFWLSDAAMAFTDGGLSPSISSSRLPVNAAQVFVCAIPQLRLLLASR